MSELYPAIDIGGAFDVEDIELGIKDEIIIKANTEPLNVTQNGTYQTPAGVDGFKPVTVDVRPVLEELTVDSNGTYTPPEGVDGFSPVNVAVSGDWEHVYHGEFYAKNDSYSGQPVLVMNLPPDLVTKGRMFWVQVRNKAGAVPGCNYGSDSLFFYSFEGRTDGITSTLFKACVINYTTNSRDGTVKYVSPTNGGNYGVFPYLTFLRLSGNKEFRITIFASKGVGTVDGDYAADVYLLKWPNGASPFVEWRQTE